MVAILFDIGLLRFFYSFT